MPNTTTNTSNRAYPLPTAGNDLAYDVAKIITALTAIDTDVATAFAQIAAKAGLASPAFSGTPTAPTAAPGTNTGQLATTAFVRDAVAALLSSTLGNDANFAATMTTALAGKVPFSIIDTDTTMAANSDAKIASQKAVKAYIDAIAAAKASLTGAETLTNKTLTSPTLNTPSLILKQSASPSPTAEGDMQWDTVNDRLVIGDGSGQKIINPNDWVKIGFYAPSGVSSIVIPNLSAFRMLRLNGWMALSIAGAINFRVSTDNGSTWVQGTGDYANGYAGQANNLSAVGVSANSFGWITGSQATGACHVFSGTFARWNGGSVDKSYAGIDTGLNSSSQNTTYVISTRFVSASNALQLFPSSGGTMTGEFTLEGMK